ncbi:MAG: lamin tail domain-containing protein [Candidatus Brennerbacteria bacterium]
MDDEFISDEEVEAYEKRSDPARRSVVWSLTAVAAVFVLVGGAYAFGYFGGGTGALSASLFGTASDEQGETFPLWSSGREEGTSFARTEDVDSGALNGACSFESGPSTSSGQAISVVFSEVAWMGTGEGAQYEWIELANVGEQPASIAGWSVVDKDGQIQIVFAKNAVMPAGGYFLLARSVDKVGSVRADVRYAGNLKNEDEGLRLLNANCEVMDGVIAGPKWPGGESAERRTMERNLTTRVWYTSSKIGGTPRAENSKGYYNILYYAPASSAESSTTAPTESEQVTTPAVATSSPSAQADLTSSPQGTVVISEVMAGKEGVGNWDFVELHNAGSSAVNLTGWSVKKRSSAGTESALVSASRFDGVTISAGGYIVLAHPDYGGAANVVWPKSYTLAYTNNSVILYNANGEKVNEISWTEIPKGQSYARMGTSFVISAPTPGTAP